MNSNNNLKWHAILDFSPASQCQSCGQEYSIITRGASALLKFDLDDYAYLNDDVNNPDPFKYIDQLTFIFKQPTGRITHYDLYQVDEAGQFVLDPEGNKIKNAQFWYDADEHCINLLLKSYETADFDLATKDDPVECEVAIRVDTEQIMIDQRGTGFDTIEIEPQAPIIVLDSLYHQAGFDKRDPLTKGRN